MTDTAQQRLLDQGPQKPHPKLKGAAKEKAFYAKLRSKVFVRNYERDLRVREFKAAVSGF